MMMKGGNGKSSNPVGGMFQKEALKCVGQVSLQGASRAAKRPIGKKNGLKRQILTPVGGMFQKEALKCVGQVGLQGASRAAKRPIGKKNALKRQILRRYPISFVTSCAGSERV